MLQRWNTSVKLFRAFKRAVKQSGVKYVMRELQLRRSCRRCRTSRGSLSARIPRGAQPVGRPDHTELTAPAARVPGTRGDPPQPVRDHPRADLQRDRRLLLWWWCAVALVCKLRQARRRQLSAKSRSVSHQHLASRVSPHTLWVKLRIRRGGKMNPQLMERPRHSQSCNRLRRAPRQRRRTSAVAEP